MKVLIVEDDPVAQLVLEAAIISLGHDVVLAGDGEAAWAECQREPAQAVVCDWQMPRLGGLELCRRIRGSPGDYVYFILLTQRAASEENHQAALEAGVDDFLTKPADIRELRMRLHVAARILGFISDVNRLEAFLPICSYCKKVRDDHDYWQQVETYVAARTHTRFSHGICPECYDSVVVPQLRKHGIPDTREGEKPP
jgi:sigma-B regulation protein RsbU (phosphoserine phosphatase)